jgi:hypothetical protein
VSYWDIYYNNIPGVSRAQTHNSLGLELDIIIKALPPKSRAYYKAEVLKSFLKVVFFFLARKIFSHVSMSRKMIPVPLQAITLSDLVAQGKFSLSEVGSMLHLGPSVHL